ncbi:PucR family transcriptional regulator [Jiangella ureilytica]|uniref:PucR family transcriptional regulator n=1 Tax=Jiangella ureilytica TaxID=2530374 RepID=A0A4R4RT88_9ACTN|nr:PucR family transcriptional regulator [Jiangella ureilytica]TDC53258.1 PucR family transcriptional regulator [Jiangella ureilytica]
MTTGVARAAEPGGPSPDRSLTSLARVLDELGTTLLNLVVGEGRLSSSVGGVGIHDPHDDSPLPPASLVLGVGVHEPHQVAALLLQLGKADAVGLIVRTPLVIDETIRMASDVSGVALLALARGASWTQVAALLRSVLAETEVGGGRADSVIEMPAGDLFTLANAVSALVDAPITIEDLDSRLIAFSSGQDDLDPLRFETILGRRCPARFRTMLEERGVFTAIYRSAEPIRVEMPDVLPRIAVAIRAGDEVLGSMWAVTEALTDQRRTAFTEAAALVALHMLRQRAGADVHRRLRTDLVATVLGGGASAGEAARQLDLAAGPAVVLALCTLPADPPVPAARAEADLQRSSDAFALHLATVHPGSACGLVRGVVYGILPVPADAEDGEDRAVRIAHAFLQRTGERIAFGIGIGRTVRTVADLAQSRLDADRALRVVRSGRAAGPVVRISDVYAAALLLELSDLVAMDIGLPDGPIRRLIEYDAEHHSHLALSLRAWLDAFGDVNAAATAVHVHPSTFRYRLRRLTEVGGLNLDDGDQRFTAMLQLRLLDV